MNELTTAQLDSNDDTDALPGLSLDQLNVIAFGEVWCKTNYFWYRSFIARVSSFQSFLNIGLTITTRSLGSGLG